MANVAVNCRVDVGQLSPLTRSMQRVASPDRPGFSSLSVCL
jgi:hypothetical protein